MNKNNHHKGFTLIELMVTMGIIAVLAGMAVFNFNQSRVRARDVQRKSDLSQLQKALEVYKNDNRSYPLATLVPLEVPQQSLLTGEYIKFLFHDPREAEWMAYKYSVGADRKTYYLMSCLENVADLTKTTDTAVCGLFKDPDDCACGTLDKGVMYIISQP